MAHPLDKKQFAALARRQFPGGEQLQQLHDDELIDAIFSSAESGQEHVLNFLRAYDINAGWFAMWRSARISKKRADGLAEVLRAAQSLHEVDNLRRADNLGIPRESLPRVVEIQAETAQAMALETHTTNEAIRLHEAQTRIDLDAKTQQGRIALEYIRKENHQQLHIAREILDQLFEAYERHNALVTSQDPSKDKKLLDLEHHIEYLRGQFHERTGRPLQGEPAEAGNRLGPTSKSDPDNGDADSEVY